MIHQLLKKTHDYLHQGIKIHLLNLNIIIIVALLLINNKISLRKFIKLIMKKY